jgi:hypothetical protein
VVIHHQDQQVAVDLVAAVEVAAEAAEVVAAEVVEVDGGFGGFFNQGLPLEAEPIR